MTTTPSMRRQLDVVALWSIYRSFQPARSLAVHPTHCLIYAQASTSNMPSFTVEYGYN